MSVLKNERNVARFKLFRALYSLFERYDIVKEDETPSSSSSSSSSFSSSSKPNQINPRAHDVHLIRNQMNVSKAKKLFKKCKAMACYLEWLIYARCGGGLAKSFENTHEPIHETITLSSSSSSSFSSTSDKALSETVTSSKTSANDDDFHSKNVVRGMDYALRIYDLISYIMQYFTTISTNTNEQQQQQQEQQKTEKHVFQKFRKFALAEPWDVITDSTSNHPIAVAQASIEENNRIQKSTFNTKDREPSITKCPRCHQYTVNSDGVTRRKGDEAQSVSSNCWECNYQWISNN
jgi:hypothetical protein